MMPVCLLDVMPLLYADLIPEQQRQDEMQKLYSAIGYSENEIITPFANEVFL